MLDALRFFQEEMTWWSLRKTYEVILAELGQPSKIDKLGLASESEISRFYAWASYYVHGKQKTILNSDTIRRCRYRKRKASCNSFS